MGWGETAAYEANGVPSAMREKKTIYFTPVVDDGISRTAFKKDARKVRDCREESAGRTVRWQPMYARNGLYGQASGGIRSRLKFASKRIFCEWRDSSDSS
jgi:hypothetical protein